MTMPTGANKGEGDSAGAVGLANPPVSPVAKLESSLLVERARSSILDAILARRFESRLPTEAELAKMLNVSRTTIRAALQTLERDGVITRRRAIGTTINSHISPGTLALQRLVDWEWFLRFANEGRDVARLVDWDRRPIPQLFVDTFSLSSEEACVHVERTYLIDGDSVLHSRAIVPECNLNGAEVVDPFPDLITTFSDLYCSKPIAHSVARINAVAFDRAESSTSLTPRSGAAFTRLCETLYAADGNIVGYGILDIDDSFLQLEVFRRRD